MDFQNLATEASDILSTAENYQWEIGRIANEVVEKYGFESLKEFSKEIQDLSGVTRTASTLRMYAYIWKASNKLGLPKDILFSNCQTIIFSDQPGKYADMLKSGASISEVKKEIYNAQKSEVS